MTRTSRGSAMIWAIAGGALALVAVLYLAAPAFLATLELKLYDQHFALRGPRPVSDGVVIVAIDETSLRRPVGPPTASSRRAVSARSP